MMHPIASGPSAGYEQEKQRASLAFAQAQQNAVGAQLSGRDMPPSEPKALDVLTRTLREIRGMCHAALEDLDGFLGRATGERVMQPTPNADATTASAIQSPIHETGELLVDIQRALTTLRAVQSRVDRIA